MVGPNENREPCNSSKARDSGVVGEQWFADKDRSDLHQRSNSRDQDDINLGVSHDPEEVGVEPAAPANIGIKEACRNSSIHCGLNHCNHEGWEGGDCECNRNRCANDEDRNAVPLHSLSTHRDDSRGDIHTRNSC